MFLMRLYFINQGAEILSKFINSHIKLEKNLNSLLKERKFKRFYQRSFNFG